jgi:putative oxidoreductase
MTSTSIPGTSAGRRAGTVALWAGQAVLAAVFAGAGLAKLAGDPAMVEMFADVGIGQWLRILVGTCEVAGAVGVLVPRLAVAAASGLALLMVGATVTNLAVLQASPVPSAALLVLAVLVAWGRRTTTQRS